MSEEKEKEKEKKIFIPFTKGFQDSLLLAIQEISIKLSDLENRINSLEHKDE